ncbi:PTS lactose/cellobiose transporter subunit IIA [Amedibacillus sp. YH-ame6]
MDNNDNETISMKIISNSGEARALSFRALEAVKKGDFTETEKLMDQAKKVLLVAHQEHTVLLVKEANGETQVYSSLVVHAQDHLMCSDLAHELIKEFIVLYKNEKEKI